MNWDRLQWKWRIFKQRLAQAGEELAPRARSGASHLKTCRECRALIARSARTCPECGARLGWFVRRGHRPGAGGLFEQTPATGILLVAIFGLYLVTWVATGAMSRGGMRGGGLLGGLGEISGRVLVRFGAHNSAVFLHGEYWRLLTAVFLHANIPHVLFNAVALYNLGSEVESVYGWARTLILFLGAGMAGSTASVLYNRLYLVGIGASGAVFGLIGVIAVFGYRRGGSYGRAIVQVAVRWAAYSLVFGFLLGADNAAHVGGLLGGAALGLVVPPERQRASASWNAAGAVAAALVPVAFALAFLRG
jgi:membrane associated rhomboid family serine protease